MEGSTADGPVEGGEKGGPFVREPGTGGRFDNRGAIGRQFNGQMTLSVSKLNLHMRPEP